MEWYEENGKHLGFIDGTYLYRVAEDENGWYWEFVPEADGMDGYDTAEKAMADAKADAKAYGWIKEEEEEREEEEGYTLEEIEEILDDMILEARREERMGW